MNDKKDVVFVIDKWDCNGASRALQVISESFSKKGYNVFIVLIREGDFYKVPKGVQMYTLSDLPCNFPLYLKITCHLYFSVCAYLKRKFSFFRERNISVLEYWNSSLYFKKLSIPLQSFLVKHPNATAFAFLKDAIITLAIAAKGLNVKSILCERNSPINQKYTSKCRKQLNKYAGRYRYSIYQNNAQKQYYDPFVSGEKKIIRNIISDALPNPFNGERTKRVVTFGRLAPEKNFPLLLNAFADIHSKYPDYHLDIYGEGSEKDTIEKMITERDLTEAVTLYPFCTDVHEKILDAAMYISTSDFEGISNSMLESMAIGLPCICTDCDGGGARDTIRDGENGIIVPKGDKIALVAAMETVINNSQFADFLGKNAYKIRDELNAEKIIKEWESLI